MLIAARATWICAVVALGVVTALPAGNPGVALAGPSAQTLVEQAIDAYNKYNCTRAVELLKRAIAIDSRYVRAYSWLGVCYERMGRTNEAIEAFNRVIALAPNSEDARTARSWLGRLQRAAPPSPRGSPGPSPTPQAGPVYLSTLPAAAGVTQDNRVRQVQLFGELYRRAIVERRNWWRGRSETEREWRVVYNLQRRYTRFRAVAGVEDGSPPEFTAVFEIRADGSVLFSSQPKRVGDVPDTIDVDITGVLQLELIVRGIDPLHTRDLTVVWADPRVEIRPGVVQPSPPAREPAAPGTPPSPPAPPSPTPTPRG